VEFRESRNEYEIEKETITNNRYTCLKKSYCYYTAVLMVSCNCKTMIVTKKAAPQLQKRGSKNQSRRQACKPIVKICNNKQDKQEDRKSMKLENG
jgi:hypothetical protein